MTIDLYTEKQKTIAFLQEKLSEVRKILYDVEEKIQAEIDACKNFEAEIKEKIEEPLEEPEKVEIEEPIIYPEVEQEVTLIAEEKEASLMEEKFVEEAKCENKPIEPAKSIERPKYRQPDEAAPRKHIKGFRIAGGH